MSNPPTVGEGAEALGSLRPSASVPTEPVTLLPCPFCGSDDVEVRAVNGGAWTNAAQVACNNCNARTGVSVKQSEVVAAWDARATSQRADGLVVVPRMEPDARAIEMIDAEWRALFGDGPDSFANPGVIHYDEFRSAMIAATQQPAGEGELWPVGSWLSAALDDPKVCAEMKRDIREWFDGNGHLRGATQQPVSEGVDKAMKALRFVADMERDTDRMGSVMIANWIIQDLANPIGEEKPEGES